ncbi:MAG: bifunctional adenosylcobinamide kinase/adenosylcobinamide-phosphate guanylyltransferase [Lachnospiraceae bacterium]|jgi:adenosylcobinamide kinase/adenosylcobinamide-phosphate guanylyltransferase|nr:bifunctional adenosylcobinamide kinase/adenosylcobinamide-phosphate guanylyltransferase [Lachnospiraceae bacterium]MDD3615956.1 bifunctional adenosylcobinamide kinase/adenosylcobinamide-phosphate guanylyltransferase [Lachnospiraceae bacterium]
MIHLITGGSGSGKSAYAESRIQQFDIDRRYYIATMQPFDEESHARIRRHRLMRKDKGFETIECYHDLETVKIEEGASVLLECMSNLVANEMFGQQKSIEETIEAVRSGVENLQRQAAEIVIVTNEIFSHTSFYEKETKDYQECLGRINQMLADMSSDVIEVVYGIPVEHKCQAKMYHHIAKCAKG